MTNRVVIHYDEIALKGGRRRLYARQLVHNIRKAAPELAETEIDRQFDRILAGPFDQDQLPAVSEALAAVPGIAWFAVVTRYPAEVESLERIAEAVTDGTGEAANDECRNPYDDGMSNSETRTAPAPSPARAERARRRQSSSLDNRHSTFDISHPSFRVQARRSKKDFPLNSNEINRIVGRHVQERTGWPVDLDNPDVTVHVDVTQKGILVYRQKQRGLGGLPVGSAGTLVCLMSGGIDSPVAAFKMICRGCRVVLVHFHNHSPDSPGVRDKNVRLARQLARYQSSSRLYLVPFAHVQSDLVAGVPAEMRMVAYRRAMLQLAEPILQQEAAKGFIMGDSIGQVASQTLENLQATYAATDYPIFSPLIGESKRSIIEQARQIGTYDISILPYDDCCRHLVAGSPETRCRLSKLAGYEQKVPLAEHAARLRNETERIDVSYAERRAVEETV